jgi:hypothetical protein
MASFILAFLGFGGLFYVQASVWESLFHEFILDLSPARRARLHRFKRWAPSAWLAHVDHGVLHHHRTYRASYVEMFSDPQEEAQLQAVLRRQYPKRIAGTFVRSRYGSTFTWEGVIPYAIPTWLNFLWLAALPGGPAQAGCAAANLVFSTPYFIFSMWAHAYLHMRFDAAMREAPGWLRPILASPYGVAVRISHYVHHQDPTVNYNLQYLADRLRGRWRAPTNREWDTMVALGLITPEHRAQFEGRPFLGHPF